MHPDSIAGYRILRKLGSGSRADVYLGHASGSTVAVKLFRPHVARESVEAEIAALTAASHAHTVQLRDLSTSHGDLPCLVLERLAGGSLAQLLGTRSSLSAGEAVTILAPVAAAVAALHTGGIVHGAVAPGAVLFRETGAPVLASFGHARSSTDTTDDDAALARLAVTVLTRVPQAYALAEWLLALEHEGYGPAFGEQLAERVFTLAPAAPVIFTEPSDAPVAPARVLTGEPVSVVEPVSVAEPVSVVERVETSLALLQRLLAHLPSRFRKPVWLAVAAGVVTLVVAFSIVPAPSSAPAPAPSATAPPVDLGPVAADDPLEAFTALVAARNGCVRDLSVLCLDDVLQSGSSAMDDDVAVIRAIENGNVGAGEAELEASATELVERHGDAALVTYGDTQTASALLVKEEAGWRIRDYLQ